MPVIPSSLNTPWPARRRLVRAMVAAPAALLAGCATATPTPAGPADGADPAQRLQAALASQPLVLLGEVHDNPEQHRLRAQALGRLLADGARPALLMEQFDRERQSAIDAAMASAGAQPDAVIRAVGSLRAYKGPGLLVSAAAQLPLPLELIGGSPSEQAL